MNPKELEREKRTQKSELGTTDARRAGAELQKVAEGNRRGRVERAYNRLAGGGVLRQ
jgi:hypothetical protein